MEQNKNENYITLELNMKLQMLCRAPHNIDYGKRWIKWTVLLVKVISSLYGHFTPHNPDPVLPPTCISGYSRSTPSSRRD